MKSRIKCQVQEGLVLVLHFVTRPRTNICLDCSYIRIPADLRCVSTFKSKDFSVFPDLYCITVWVLCMAVSVGNVCEVDMDHFCIGVGGCLHMHFNAQNIECTYNEMCYINKKVLHSNSLWSYAYCAYRQLVWVINDISW